MYACCGVVDPEGETGRIKGNLDAVDVDSFVAKVGEDGTALGETFNDVFGKGSDRCAR